MKASEFKNLIKEAVREVLKEELTGLTQQPLQETGTTPYKRTGNSIVDMLAETRATMTSTDFKNIVGADSSMAQSFDKSMFIPKQDLKPASVDPEAVARSVAHAPKVGLDISQLSFVNKAAAIVNAADKKQKEKYGV